VCPHPRGVRDAMGGRRKGASLAGGYWIWIATQPSTNFTPGIEVVSKSKSPQPENAPYPMLVTPSPIVTLVISVQSRNA
jgi:hypothetical protein